MMRTLIKLLRISLGILVCIFLLYPVDLSVDAQDKGKTQAVRGNVRTITIPITIKPKRKRLSEELRVVDLAVSEDGQPRQNLSIRTATDSPLSLAILVQDDLVSSIGNEIKPLASFIRALPSDSRVLIGTLGIGSLRVRQKFTKDLNRASSALRIPLGSASSAPYNPYVEVVEALRRFDSQPVGRRAILLISDGVDVSRGLSESSPTQSIDLQRAIAESQRRGVAIYSFYAPTAGLTSGNNSFLISNGQSSLARLSDETGGKAFFQGTGQPVSFDPFIRELQDTLYSQIALTFLSTSENNGFHRLEVSLNAPDMELRYPRGYSR
ncbi:MAG: hypothetical protein ACRD63_00330 [Pyrinomonadaceae bacterium]